MTCFESSKHQRSYQFFQGRLNRLRYVGFLFCVGLFTALAMAQNPVQPCTSDEHSQFDFWIGNWQVHGADGKFAGHNLIRKMHTGCVLHEQYSTPSGYSGESFNIYDPGRKVWHQTWVDNAGMLLLLEGGLIGNSMVLQGETTDSKGVITKHRITWTPNPEASVRQQWETLGSSGKWITVFDGKYTRKSAR
jgi:hypothetical protein